MVPWQISISSARRLSPPRRHHRRSRRGRSEAPARRSLIVVVPRRSRLVRREDRKSTRLNSSHVAISYAVFCLKKKTENKRPDAAFLHIQSDISLQMKTYI